MKRSIVSRYRPWQSEFSHRYACWANNHRGWQKMKKLNLRLAKRRLYREERIDIGKIQNEKSGNNE